MAHVTGVKSSLHNDRKHVVHDSDDQPSHVWAKQQEVAELDGPATGSLKDGKLDDYDSNARAPYEHMDFLGRGHSGLVEKVQHKSTKQIYARKLMAVPKRKQAEQESIFLNEIAIIRKLYSHRHFVEVIEAYRTKQHFAIILWPVAEDGDLSEYLDRYCDIKKSTKNTESTNLEREAAETKLKAATVVLEQAFGCLVSGLAFMHEQQIRHRDIKPQNVLMHSGTVFFTDFGYSLDSSPLSQSATEGRPSFVTRRYCAPEVLEHERRDSSSDVWSLGCVLIEVLSALTHPIEIDGNPIYSEAMPKIHAGLVNASISDEYLPLIQTLIGMTSLEASMRPSSKVVQESLVMHPSFNCAECRAGTSMSLTAGAVSQRTG